MRSLWLGFGLCAVALGCVLAVSSAAQEWKELKGDHFIIYYVGDDRFANEVLREAERYYRQISVDLGYERYSNFWQWEKRAKIYIYPTQEDFLKETGRQGWSHGFANFDTREILSYAWKDQFLESLLPHEITHLIFRDYVGFKGEIPLWLDEGVAQWEEPGKRAIVRGTMKSVLRSRKGFSLKDLTEVDIRNANLEQSVQMFYIQAASLVDFLVEEHGADNFISFCRQLRDGKSLNEALRFTYPTKIRSLNELEEQWKRYILDAPG
ncbi:MAG: hypothetical protein HY584_03650 [Candidatus Omnitrophica bacterium]|nr:hypothetical protein [Candidatus Omnitrophota bacterium]